MWRNPSFEQRFCRERDEAELIGAENGGVRIGEPVEHIRRRVVIGVVQSH